MQVCIQRAVTCKDHCAPKECGQHVAHADATVYVTLTDRPSLDDLYQRPRPV